MSSKAAKRTPTEWIPAGRSVTIQGTSIASGMIYVGGDLSGNYGRTENCLVDPTLPVSRSTSDKSGVTMPYWPSYSDIRPEARRSYLDWLAGGRSDPDIGIGYVFLFFYGLERRLFVDQATDEAPIVRDEIERLLALYNSNHSFQGYARKCLDAISVISGDIDNPPILSPSMHAGYEIPLAVRFHLGHRLANKSPFTADEALLWVLSLPDTYLRTPGVRCFDEFCVLWRVRFSERYPNGLKVRVPKKTLKADYHSASGTFQVKFSVSDGSIPDIAAINAPLDGLRELANACTDELDAYSRLLGRRPDVRGNVEAVALLPREILDTSDSSPVRVIRSHIDALLGLEQFATMQTRKLLSTLSMDCPESGKIPAASANQIGSILDKLDIAYEPDRRYGPTSLSLDGTVTLFRSANGAPVDTDRAEYQASRTMMEISALAAASDGEVVGAELKSIMTELEAMEGLNPRERMRLHAHVLSLLADMPRQHGAMRRLSSLPESDRRRVVQSAFSAVLADGHISAAEVKFLEKLYKALKLPQEDVYAALHRGDVSIDEPVKILPEQYTPGTPVPQPPLERTGVQIDPARLARIQNETSTVSSLLADIFVEEEPIVSNAPVSPTGKSACIYDGLDAAHGELLAKIVSAVRMTRAIFEDESRMLTLLPDGALETINDWGFEVFGEPVLEGDDDIEVATHLRPELQKLEVVE
ncbi:MAG: TerB N-terminal domain-containing protein [Parvibaculum sp.]|uniref:tellurite resistance TerB family protein n=1 Tax=Parvibaculum sp. TaxID=2024848 RepID=UPI0032EC814E